MTIKQAQKRASLEAKGWNQIGETRDGCLSMSKTLFSGEKSFCYIRKNGTIWSNQK